MRTVTLAPRDLVHLAQEGAHGVAGLLPWIEMGVTALLVVATLALFYATLQVHKDEINKMGDHLSHDNDNMTDVALASINNRRQAVRRHARRAHTAIRRAFVAHR